MVLLLNSVWALAANAEALASPRAFKPIVQYFARPRNLVPSSLEKLTVDCIQKWLHPLPGCPSRILLPWCEASVQR